MKARSVGDSAELQHLPHLQALMGSCREELWLTWLPSPKLAQTTDQAVGSPTGKSALGLGLRANTAGKEGTCSQSEFNPGIPEQSQESA